MKFFILLLLISIQVLSDESVRIDSQNKYEIIKQKKMTKIFQLSPDGKTKKQIFNKIIRDSVQWIFSEKNSSTVIIVTRPMIAGPEVSRFWKSQNGVVTLLGKTKCLDHQVDKINQREISYSCYRDDPNKPFDQIVEKVTIKI